MDPTITCPSCGSVEGKVTVESIATLAYSGTVQAEINIAEDLIADNGTHTWEHKHVVEVRDRLNPSRELSTFRRDGDPSELNLVDWSSLELDNDQLIAFCWQCQSDVTEQFKQLLDARVPLEPQDPTDDEIYNRTQYVPDGRDENHWSL